jgi:hypothetical protein
MMASWRFSHISQPKTAIFGDDPTGHGIFFAKGQEVHEILGATFWIFGSAKFHQI